MIMKYLHSVITQKVFPYYYTVYSIIIFCVFVVEWVKNNNNLIILSKNHYKHINIIYTTADWTDMFLEMEGLIEKKS